MKIVLLHPQGGMGDLILSYPVIHTFREAYPRGEIVVVTPPGLEEVIGLNPEVSRVISLAPGIKSALRLANYFREERIDIGCALWSTALTALALRLGSVPIRIGQGGRFFYSFLFTHSVQVRSAGGDEESHWVECLLDYPRALGIQPGNKDIRLDIPEAALRKAERLLQEAGVSKFEGMAVLHCGKGEDLQKRGWPFEKFARVADKLIQQGCDVVLTGNQKEIPLVETVRSFMQEKGYSIAGETDFLTLGAVLKLAKLIICPDSGPMHLAAAVGTPVVALFLMQKDFPSRWGPWGVPSRIIRPQSFPCQRSCTKENCRDFRCVQEMPVDEIVQSALDLMRSPVVEFSG